MGERGVGRNIWGPRPSTDFKIKIFSIKQVLIDIKQFLIWFLKGREPHGGHQLYDDDI